MAKYPVNKGIGRSPEFKGLKSQYLFIFAGGLLALFVVFVIMYMVGIDQWVCIGFGVVSASVLVWATFRMNAKYGEWGAYETPRAAQPSPLHHQPEEVPSVDFSNLKKRKSMRNVMKNSDAGKQISVALGRARVYRQQGCGHYRGL